MAHSASSHRGWGIGFGSSRWLLVSALAGCTTLTGLDNLRSSALEEEAPQPSPSSSPDGGSTGSPRQDGTGGNEIEDATAPPPDAPDGASNHDPEEWNPLSFTAENRLGTCAGAKYVRYSATYDLWVGVILCSETRYKIYLGASRSGTYYEVADQSGGGEDHCELVNPSFTLGSGGSISSGNCPTCKFDYAGTGVTGDDASVYTRNAIGERPVFRQVWPSTAYTGRWYECGVSIP